MGYVIGKPDSRITLNARQGDEEISVAHVHREPTTSEIKEYMRRQAEAAMDGADAEYGGAEEALWEAVIIAVEGYEDAEGKDIMERPDWKSLVPPHHKLSVAFALGSVLSGRGRGKKKCRKGEKEKN